MNVTTHQNSNESLSILIWKLSIGSTLSWEISRLLGSA